MSTKTTAVVVAALDGPSWDWVGIPTLSQQGCSVLLPAILGENVWCLFKLADTTEREQMAKYKIRIIL